MISKGIMTMMNGTPLNIHLYVCLCVTRMSLSRVYMVCTCTNVGCCIINSFLVLSMQVGVWWWLRSQIRAMPAMPSSVRCTMSQETLAGVYKWTNSLLGHPLIQVPSRCSNYLENLSFHFPSTFALFAQVLVWVVMSLLPLVAGGRSRFRAESEAAVGFAGMRSCH